MEFHGKWRVVVEHDEPDDFEARIEDEAKSPWSPVIASGVWSRDYANLIAAAPELLESLGAVVSTVCANCVTCEPPDYPNGCGDLRRAKAVIAKATGQPQ